MKRQHVINVITVVSALLRGEARRGIGSDVGSSHSFSRAVPNQDPSVLQTTTPYVSFPACARRFSGCMFETGSDVGGAMLGERCWDAGFLKEGPNDLNT